MDLPRANYKYEHVAERLRHDIREGCYPHGVLPREVDLVEQLGVSRITISHALTRLAREGIVRRVKGQGTFINQAGGHLNLQNQVGLVMQAGGHFFGALYSAVRRHLMAKGCFSVSLDVHPGYQAAEDLRAAWYASLHSLMSSPVRAVIVDGSGYAHYPFIERYPDQAVTFIHCYDAPGPVPVPAVVADFHGAVGLATRHLIALGHRHIGLIALQPPDTPLADPSHIANSPIRQLRQGYLDALAGHGLEPDIFIPMDQLDRHPREAADLLRGYLARPRRPTAVVCTMDYLGVQTVMRAGELGLSVPGDLAVTGIYNTPWAELSPVPLTSVSMGEDELARRAVEFATGTPSPDLPVRVRPRLVIRHSCGASPPSPDRNLPITAGSCSDQPS